MTALIAIGYWNDDHDENRFIWPQEIAQAFPVPDMLKMTDYLSKGNIVRSYFGFSYCRICKKDLGTSCLTDGTYVWPEKLEHYTQHNIILPIKFITHAKQQNWEIKEANYEDRKDIEVDWNFWIDWCKKNKNARKLLVAKTQEKFNEYKEQNKLKKDREEIALMCKLARKHGYDITKGNHEKV